MIQNEKIRIRKITSPNDETENFIRVAFAELSEIYPDAVTDLSSLGEMFAKYYRGHSGDKFIGGGAYSSLDGFSLVDDDGYDAEADDSGVIDSWSGFSSDFGKVIAYTYGKKWISQLKSIEKHYADDFEDEETYSETIENDLRDVKEYGKSNSVTRGVNVTVTDTNDQTNSVSGYDATAMVDSDKTSVNGTSTTTADADKNVTTSTDKGTDTTSHLGTKKRTYTRSGGNEKWRRGREMLAFIATDCFEMFAKDIDRIATLPYYCF